MKIETKLNIATALAVIVFGFSLCASAVTADWDAVKRLVGDAASGGSNNVSAAVSTLRGEIASATPSDYGSVKSAALSAVQPSDLEPYCTIEAARQMTNGIPVITAETVGGWGFLTGNMVGKSITTGTNTVITLGAGTRINGTDDAEIRLGGGLLSIPANMSVSVLGSRTLANFGIGNAYTKAEVDSLIAGATPSDYNTVKSNASAGSSHAARTDNPHGVTAAKIGAASADDLAPLASDIMRAYQYSRTISLYMTGSTNAWFAGTNYVFGADAESRAHFAWEAGMDAATVPCSMALWEIRDGVRQCVWDQRDWPTWYWSFKAAQMKAEINASNDVFRAAVNQQINSDENHAWAKRYASSGRVNPDPSTTFIDTKSVCLSPGMSWETVATVDGCGYWTIVGDGAVIGGSGTNAVLDIKDFEGNSIIKITKGEHRLAWVERGEIIAQSRDSNGWVCFDMLADVQPTGYFSTTLELDDFVSESDAGCPAQFTWENRGGGVWRIHYLLKPGIVSDACFAKFQVEVEGKTQIRYEADTVINGGLIFNGVKIAPVIQSGAAVGSTVTWKVVQ